jgi:hypothetical protein
MRYRDMQTRSCLSGLFFLSILSFLAPAALAEGEPREPVNAVIGDQSAEGITEKLSERARLQVHLEFVEKMLRERPTDHLSRSQRRSRGKVLDRLREYRLRGEFPTNQYSSQRAPVFVDAQGVRCAVGAIAEPDVGTPEVERISRVSRLAYIEEIDSPLLIEWAGKSGFSLEELATIQPTYRGGGSVEMPRDPWPVEKAQSRLATAWRSCRSEAYPANVGWGASQVHSTVTFLTAKNESSLRVKLELKSTKQTGTEHNPAPSKKESRDFLACVKLRFSGQRYRPADGVDHGTRYGLSLPNYGGPLVREDNGELALGPARTHVLERLNMLTETCSVPQRSWYQVKVAVTPEGGVQAVQVIPYSRFPDKEKKDAGVAEGSDPVASCISKRLPEILRFPRSKASAEVTVRGR